MSTSLRLCTVALCPVKILSMIPNLSLSSFQLLILPSWPPEYNLSELRFDASAVTPPKWASLICWVFFPVFGLKNRITPSDHPLTTLVPSLNKFRQKQHPSNIDIFNIGKREEFFQRIISDSAQVAKTSEYPSIKFIHVILPIWQV